MIDLDKNQLYCRWWEFHKWTKWSEAFEVLNPNIQTSYQSSSPKVLAQKRFCRKCLIQESRLVRLK